MRAIGAPEEGLLIQPIGTSDLAGIDEITVIPFHDGMIATTIIGGEQYGYIQRVEGQQIVSDSFFVIESKIEIEVGIDFPGITIFQVRLAQIPQPL